MKDKKYLHITTENFKFGSEIKRYYYNETYKLWTIVFFNDDVLFIYDKNILNLVITKNNKTVCFVNEFRLCFYEEDGDYEEVN